MSVLTAYSLSDARETTNGSDFRKYFQILLAANEGKLFEPRHEKTGFCICENKDADQLRSNCAAVQRLCFRYIDSTISLLPIREISSL